FMEGRGLYQANIRAEVVVAETLHQRVMENPARHLGKDVELDRRVDLLERHHDSSRPGRMPEAMRRDKVRYAHRHCARSLLQTPDRCHEGRHDGLPVTHYPIARLAENVRFGVFVDGHDDLCARAARHMLACPRDAHGNVQVWGDRLARKTHLPVARHPAGVHCSPGRTHSGAELARQLLQLTKRFRASQATPTRYDNTGVFSFTP